VHQLVYFRPEFCTHNAFICTKINNLFDKFKMNQNNAVLFHFLKQKQRQGRFQLLAQGGFLRFASK